MTVATVNDEIRQFVDRLPEEIEWEQLQQMMYDAYVRAEIDAGIEELDRGESISMEQVRQEFGIVR